MVLQLNYLDPNIKESITKACSDRLNHFRINWIFRINAHFEIHVINVLAVNLYYQESSLSPVLKRLNFKISNNLKNNILY